MLQRVDVVYGNESGEQAMALPIIGATPKDSLLVRSITGLDAPDVDLFIGDYARDGGIYQGRRVGPRNPVITLDLNPNPALGETVSGLRELIYKTFLDPLATADHSQLILREDDGRARYLVGYVEKIESDIFTDEPMVQISMICPDPFIRDLIETTLSNPFGWINVPFSYAGTAGTGFEADISVNVATPTLILSNNGRTMVLNYAFLPGDVVRFNTNAGSLAITLTRAGVTTSLIARLTTTSRWLELSAQTNEMLIYGSDPTSRPATITELRYTTAYWGI